MMFTYDFFIAYSRHDARFAESLVRSLGRRGARGFMDRADVASGAAFGAAIKEAIERSEGMILILSLEGLQSNWVMAEVGVGQSLHKPIVPVLKPGASIDYNKVKDLLGADVLYVDAGKLRMEEVTSRVFAAIKGVPLAEVRRRRSTARRRRVTAILIALFVLALILLWLMR